MWKLALLALGAAAYFGKQKLDQLFQGLSFEPAGLKFSQNSLGLVSTRFGVDLKIFNKSNVPVPIQSIAGKLIANNAELSAFNVQKPFTIPGNNSTTVNFEVTANNLEALKFLLGIVLKGTIPQIQMKGGVFTLLGTAPIDVVYQKIQLITPKK